VLSRCPRVECVRNLPECPCARLLSLADDRKHVGRVAVRLSLHRINGALAGRVEPRVAFISECRAAGEPLAMIQPEIRKEWLETLDRAFDALATLSVGLAQAMNTMKALQSETSDFPVKLPVPDLGQSVLNLAAERRDEAPAPVAEEA
jgi:hypothetical protein